MANQVHPLFAGIISHIAPAESSLKEYRRLLLAHDWHFEYSDSHAEWAKGKGELDALLLMCRAVDKDAAIWNLIAPASHQRIEK